MLVAPMFILPIQGNLRGMLNHLQIETRWLSLEQTCLRN
jgi:hypothetical protein